MYLDTLTYGQVQDEFEKWCRSTFGDIYTDSKEERAHRFFEEATELIQSGSVTREMAHKIVDVVFNKPIEQDIGKEFAGVMVTFAGLAYAYDINYFHVYTTEREYRHANIDKIRAKQQLKAEQGHSMYKDGGWNGTA